MSDIEYALFLPRRRRHAVDRKCLFGTRLLRWRQQEASEIGLRRRRLLSRGERHRPSARSPGAVCLRPAVRHRALRVA